MPNREEEANHAPRKLTWREKTAALLDLPAEGVAGTPKVSLTGDRELYLGFVQGLGASGVEGQLEHLELYAALVGPLLHRAREDRERRSRLYVALGAFGGMALCLALL